MRVGVVYIYTTSRVCVPFERTVRSRQIDKCRNGGDFFRTPHIRCDFAVRKVDK